MSRFQNIDTGVIVSVDDSKDERFANGWVNPDEVKRSPGRPKKSDS